MAKKKQMYLPVPVKGSQAIIKAFPVTRCKCVYPDDGGRCNYLAYNNPYCYYHEQVRLGLITSPVKYIFKK